MHQTLNTQTNSAEQQPNQLDLHEHFNLPQLLAYAINANLTVGEWGRGTGKSVGAVAPRMVHCAKAMPRMAGTFLAPSYRKFMDHMWSGIRRGFTEKMKLQEGRDFLFLKEPPAHWPRPYSAPGTYGHFIPFSNGSGYHIISFDHGQTSNSLDTDVNITDEGKLIDGTRAQEEVYNTMRGNLDHFGDLPEHYSKWIFSDKFVRSDSKQSRWYSEYKGQVDQKLIQEILLTVLAIQQSVNPRLILHLQRKLKALQKQATFYSEASTIDNIHAVGIEYVEGLAKTNSSYGILTSIFNMDLKRSDGKGLFYPQFTEYKNSYNASDNDRVDELIQTIGHDSYLQSRTCALDKDHMPDEPLMVLLDLGGSYNWAVVAQKRANIIRCIKDFCIPAPLKTKDMVQSIHDYYSKGHRRKLIKLYWPKDADNATYSDDVTDVQKIIKWFEELGWTVDDKMPENHRFISHKKKFEFGQYIFDMKPTRDERFPIVLLNASNCTDTISSISNCKLKPGEIKYEKEKKGEKKKENDQRKEPHLSDALDWLCIDYLDYLSEENTGYTTSLHTLNK